MTNEHKDTFFSRAQADADLTGGRFKKVTETRVTYPQQPASSPWSQGIDQTTGVEPPLSVDELPSDLGGDVVGVDALPSADDLGGPEAPNDATCPSAVETKPAQTTNSMKRRVW
jgi:hypothetical protein